ncbi:uncharacterized protein LODBEIA_P06960 [Lodderomyces beijingensis]|uniref:TLDc domain-containing protein n=1 Tax=Lodderomyces beijingensis TaxID=1775926 RepID=A0ABP0ZGD4_9ASCO
MGQASSTSEDSASHSPVAKLSREQIVDLFYARCLSLLKPIEIAFIKTKWDIHGNQGETIDSAEIFKWYLSEEQADKATSNLFRTNMSTLLMVMKRIGKFPFLNSPVHADDKLTVREFIISMVFFDGRFKKIFKGDYDFVKLFCIALAAPAPVSGTDDATASAMADDDNDRYAAKLLQPFEADDSKELKSRKVNWTAMDLVRSFDGISVQDLAVNARKLQELLILLLVVKSVPNQKHEVMREKFWANLSKWKEFDAYSLYLLRYLDIQLDAKSLSEQKIKYLQFSDGMASIVPRFLEQNIQRFFEAEIHGASSAARGDDSHHHLTHSSEPMGKVPKFQESKLVNSAFLALASAILEGAKSPIVVSSQNMVKLYAGSESGFSIRSLETKIFKWQAPTMVLVSGKRLKQKAQETNRRYEKFDHSFPRYFLNSENALRPWQHENDRITYCVVINQPWRNSNKNNFGDEKSIILAIQPRADYFKSVSNKAQKGESIYFNTQGMGVGFGNEQPINKGNTQKYHPGRVSLTIEANLEFAVFRHLSSSVNNDPNFFKTSSNSQIANEDYEDRFVITDLEVWGIGSMKELEEQQRQWKWEEQQAQARQSVNIRNMGEERAFLEMVGLVGNRGSGGSV